MLDGEVENVGEVLLALWAAHCGHNAKVPVSWGRGHILEI